MPPRRLSRAAAFVLVAAALAIASPHPAFAAPDASDSGGGLREFCAERPGKATPACIVDKGHLQAEVGAVDGTFTESGGLSTQAWTFGEANLRYGLTRSLEAHIDWAPFTTVRVHDVASGATAHASGTNDVEFAFKQSLTDPDAKGLAVALEPYFTAPTGTHGMSAGGWQTGVLLPVSANLPAGFGLGLTPELDLVKDNDGRGDHAAWSGVVSVSHEVGPVSLGAELWAQRDQDPLGHTTQASFDLTTAWTPKALPATQFDIAVYLGLNQDTPDVEVTAGIARRF